MDLQALTGIDEPVSLFGNVIAPNDHPLVDRLSDRRLRPTLFAIWRFAHTCGARYDQRRWASRRRHDYRVFCIKQSKRGRGYYRRMEYLARLLQNGYRSVRATKVFLSRPYLQVLPC